MTLFEMMNFLNQMRANPAQILAQRGMNVPQGVSDPQAILNHLLRTGQISQQQINSALQMAKMFR